MGENRNNNELRLAAICSHSYAFADEPAAVIWLQGCLKSCKGCMAPMWQSLNRGEKIDVDFLADYILSLDNIALLVVSGGEPLLQAASLRYLLRKIRGKSSLGLILYTGYSDQEITRDKEKKLTINLFDIAVTGPYIEDMNKSQGLRGSNNQNVHVYNSAYDGLKDQILMGNRKIEVELNHNGYRLIGIPPKSIELSKLFKEIEGNGIY